MTNKLAIGLLEEACHSAGWEYNFIQQPVQKAGGTFHTVVQQPQDMVDFQWRAKSNDVVRAIMRALDRNNTREQRVYRFMQDHLVPLCQEAPRVYGTPAYGHAVEQYATALDACLNHLLD